MYKKEIKHYRYEFGLSVVLPNSKLFWVLYMVRIDIYMQK